MDTQKYHDFCWNGQLPVNMVQLANCAGVQVLETFPHDSEHCVAFDDNNGKPIIYIKSTEVSKRKRFIIAHVLCKWEQKLTSKKEVEYFGRENFTMNGSYQDMITNNHAMNLLVPMKLLKYAIHHWNMTHPIKLAQLFDVSEVLIAEQIKKL